MASEPKMTIDTKRLRATLEEATVPPRWAVCELAKNAYWFNALTIGAEDDGDARRVADAMTPENAALIVAAINALPALLDLAERYAEAPEIVVTHWEQAQFMKAGLKIPDESMKLRLVRTTGESE